MSTTEIISVRGRRVWDSRGRPTVEAEVTLAGGALGRAIAPAGASGCGGGAADLRHLLGQTGCTPAANYSTGSYFDRP